MLKPEPSNAPRPLLGRDGRVPFSVLGLALIALVFAVMAGKLWAAPPAYRSADTALSGQLRIVGTRHAADPVRQWAAIFRREHPGVHFSIMLYGGGTAADALAQGEADVAPLSRNFKPSERELVFDAGAKPRAVTVGTRCSDHRPDQPLYLYTNSPGNALATEFVRVALSEEGQAVLSGCYAPVSRKFAPARATTAAGNIREDHYAIH